MLSSTTQNDTLRRRLVIAAAAIALALGGVTAYALLNGGPGTDQPRPVAPADALTSGAVAVLPESPTVLATIVPGSDPETFARLVSGALFAWDTATTTTTNDLTERLIVLADPTGESSAGLRADIANYLPTPVAWSELRRYETRQWVEITTVEVPGLWSTAVEQAGPDGLLPGTAAYTIHGVRRRSGIWEGAPVTSAHDVSFTVFVVCGPTYPECHLLRLSRLDAPLG